MFPCFVFLLIKRSVASKKVLSHRCTTSLLVALFYLFIYLNFVTVFLKFIFQFNEVAGDSE